MEYVSELTVLQYLETQIKTAFSDDEKVVVTIDPDVDINLIDTDNQSTPTIVIELVESTTIGENAVLGHALSVATQFKISALSAKEERKTYVENKTRNVGLVNTIRTQFETQTTNKIDWDGVEFFDFPLGDIPAMISIITVTTYNRNFDYS